MKKNRLFTISTLALALAASSPLAAMGQKKGSGWQSTSLGENVENIKRAVTRPVVEQGNVLGIRETIVSNRLQNPIRIRGALGLLRTIPAQDSLHLQSRISDLFECEILREKGGLVIGKLSYDLKEIIRHIEFISQVTIREDSTLSIRGILKEGSKPRGRDYIEWALDSIKAEQTKKGWPEAFSRTPLGIWYKYAYNKMSLNILRGDFLDLYCHYGTPEQNSGAPYCQVSRMNPGERAIAAGLERSVYVTGIRPLSGSKILPTPPSSPRPGGALVPISGPQG